MIKRSLHFFHIFDPEWRQSMVFYKAYVGEKANFMQYRVTLVSNKPINKQDKNPLPVK